MRICCVRCLQYLGPAIDYLMKTQIISYFELRWTLMVGSSLLYHSLALYWQDTWGGKVYKCIDTSNHNYCYIIGYLQYGELSVVVMVSMIL
jgi:hypothetical protein